MTATLVGALVTAVALGATHAIEPDHVAGISSLTSRYGDPRLAAIVGVCFGVGHVVLVVMWVVIAYLILGTTSFPGAIDTLGTVGVSILLALLGTLLTIRGYRAAAHAHAQDAHSYSKNRGRGQEHQQHRHSKKGYDNDHQHSHDAGRDTDPHLHLPLVDSQGHKHTTHAYLKTGIVGALFTLSPPLSMIAFAGAMLPAFGFEVVTLAVLAYATSIILAMAAVGAGISTIFRFSERHGLAYGAVRVVVGVGTVGFAVVMFGDAFALF